MFFRKKLSFPESLSEIYETYPNEKIIGLFDFRQPYYFIRDTEVVKRITIKDFDHFVDHKTFVDSNSDRLLGNSLFALRGDKWRHMRTTLSPAFTGSKMRQMFEFVIECAEQMVNHHEMQLIDQNPNPNELQLDMKDIFAKYTNDVIASCAFGIKIDSYKNENNEFYKTGKHLTNFENFTSMMKIFLIHLCPNLMKLLQIEFIDSNAGNFFKSMILDTIEVRTKQDIYRSDVINMLMQVKKGKQIDGDGDGDIQAIDEGSIHHHHQYQKIDNPSKKSTNNNSNDNQQKWNDDEIVAQCFLFFLAGFETTSSILSFLSYELARNNNNNNNNNIQEKLFNEIWDVHCSLNGQRITYEILQKMEYMEMCIAETLRKWPAIASIDRICDKDYLYDDGQHKFTIRKGQSLLIPVYAFHHDPKYWSNPNEFDPERFHPDNRKNLNMNAYLPFGVGPRICIGSRFALMEIKILLYYLILNFKIQSNDKTQIPIKLATQQFGLFPEKPISLSLTLRNK